MMCEERKRRQDAGAASGTSLRGRESQSSGIARRIAALEQRNDELESFVRALAHDCGALTRGIALRAEMLRERVRGANRDTTALIETIEDRARRLGQMTAGLMRLTRIAACELECEDVDLSAVAREVADELRRDSPARAVAVEIHPGMTVRADRALVRLALENLVGNAWKYTGAATQARIEIGCRRGGDETAFFVADNGPGFPPESAATLFSPFVRLNSARAFDGNGIGLSTVKRVVQRHGGWIRAECNGDGGALFLFTFGGEAGAARGIPDAA